MTYTGRTAERMHRGSKLCAGCNQRVMVGDPKPSSTWPGQLYLSKAQCDLLLVAAAEFVEIGGGTAIEFVDWVSPDALRPPGTERLHTAEADGAPPRYDGGAVAQSNARNAHRHPFPLAQVEWRPSRREG